MNKRLLWMILGSFLLVFPAAAEEDKEIPPEKTEEQISPPAETGTLKLHITDAATGKPTPARVRLRREGDAGDGQYIRPENSLKVYAKLPYAYFRRADDREEFFYSPAEFESNVPVGKYNILVEKGFEYTPSENNFEISKDGTVELPIGLSRWIDMAAEGWMPGDPHLHFNRKRPGAGERMLELFKAEDLKIGYLLMSTSYGKTANIQPVFGKEGSLYSEGYSLHAAEEFTSDVYGHLSFIGIPELIEPLGTGERRGITTKADYPPNHDFTEKVKKLGGTVIACHGGYGEFSVDLAFGLIDAVEILQGNKWEWWVGKNRLFVPHWYHALNCGFKLPGVAGSDYPVLFQKIIANVRNYVYVGEDRSDEAWIRGLKAGRVFVTNGPMMMDFTVDGRMMGETIKLRHPGEKVKVKVRIRALYPLDTVEIIRNGVIIRSLANKENKTVLEYEEEIPIYRSSWIAARATGKHPDPIRGGFFLHGNPVYLELGGKPVLVADSAAWWLERIDDLIAWAEKKAVFDTGEQKERTLQIFRKGRKHYQDLLARCRY